MARGGTEVIASGSRRVRGHCQWLALGPGSLLVGVHGIEASPGGSRWDRGHCQWLAVGLGSLLVGLHGIGVSELLYGACAYWSIVWEGWEPGLSALDCIPCLGQCSYLYGYGHRQGRLEAAESDTPVIPLGTI